MPGVTRFTGSIRLTGKFQFDFEGAPRDPRIAVQFYGYFRGYISLANICRQWINMLAQCVEGFGFHDYTRSGGVPELPYPQREGVNPNAPVAIYYGFPNFVPDDMRTGHRIVIGAFVCETDRIPDEWVERCNEFDLIIVPSRFCQRAFTTSGVTTPIGVVPHGIDPEYIPAQEGQRDSPFVFYNTFAASSFPRRKGAEELVRGFLRAFAGRDDVILRLRTENSPFMQALRERYDFGNLIRLEPPEPLETAEFAALYHRACCTVHPSLAEGFGLIPFQSIACATPVIAPAATGMADYLTPDNAMLLRTAGTVEGVGAVDQRGRFQAVDEDHLVELLRYATDHWETEYAKVQRASSVLRERYRWDRVLAPLATLLNELAGSETRATAKSRLDEAAGSLTPR